MENAALFLAGIAVGLGIYRFIMILILEEIDPTVCDFCQWNIKKQELSKKR